MRIYRIQPWEFWLSIVCFVGVAVFGAIPGIGFAIVIAVIEFLWDGWRPHSAVLGRAEGVKGYHDITRYPDARQVPASSCSAGTRRCSSPTPSCSGSGCSKRSPRSPTPVRWLVVAAEPVTSVDVTAADALAELDEALHDAGHRAAVRRTQGPGEGQAQAIRPVRADSAKRSFFPTIGAAVSSYLETHAAWMVTRLSTRPVDQAARGGALSMNWLLVFIPITIGLEHCGSRATSPHLRCVRLAILPLAGWMGRATEQLAERMGEGVGGLLNATFGNAAELIIALAALRAGLHDVVKASIAGSIVGNMLLVLGAAMLAGGLRHPEQHFNAAGGALAGDDADAGGDRADRARRLPGRCWATRRRRGSAR